MTLVAGAVSAISFLPWIVHVGGSRDERGGPGAGAMLLTLILAPLVAALVQMAISRSREYAADQGGAGLSGDPAGLANALRKLHRRIPETVPLTDGGGTAHLMIANPFTGHSVARLFSTHPDPEERIRRLEDMAAGRR